VYHHVTGIDASSSASLAAYVNTLTFSPLDKTHKVVSGIYWSEFLMSTIRAKDTPADIGTAATMHSLTWTCESKLRFPEA
jgi:hypothetical protein